MEEHLAAASPLAVQRSEAGDPGVTSRLGEVCQYYLLGCAKPAGAVDVDVVAPDVPSVAPEFLVERTGAGAGPGSVAGGGESG